MLGATLIITVALTLLLAGLIKWLDTEMRISRRDVLDMKTRFATASVSEFGMAQIKARLARVNYFPPNEFQSSGGIPPVLPDAATVGDGTLTKKEREAKKKAAEKQAKELKDAQKDVDEAQKKVDDAQKKLAEELLKSLTEDRTSEIANAQTKLATSQSTLAATQSALAALQQASTVGGLLDGLTEYSAISSLDLSGSSSSSESFRYEMSPQNLVVGKFDAWRLEKIDATNPLYNGDPLDGQNVLVRQVDMVSAAKVTDTVAKTSYLAYCEQTLQVRDAPLTGYALFYNMDLEIAPGAAMEIYGPVHANGNIYVQSGAGLAFYGGVTTAGDVRYGRAPGAASAGSASGAVSFKAGDASQISMLQDGTWLDSANANWTAKASQLWNGNVRSRAHGINPANPAAIPNYVPDDPVTSANELQNSAHVLIEPSTMSGSTAYPGDEVEVQKYASKASIVLTIDGSGSVKAYKYTPNGSGDYVRLSTNGTARYDRTQLNVPDGLIVAHANNNVFYDTRRAKWIKSTDIDVSVLKSAIENDTVATGWKKGNASFSPATEWNGIVYVEGANTSSGAVRLVNGSSIPNRPTAANGYAKGFTIATNLPAYVKGNYNADGNIPATGSLIREPDSANEPPASIAADAITIQSNAWVDANSSAALSSRKASATEIAAAFLTGIVPSNKNSNSTYSGGVENLPRLLEDWAGVKLGYRGSMIVLYESQIATEPWGSSNVYAAATRIWGFSSLFAAGTLPPGTPYSRWYRRITCRDLDADMYNAEVVRLCAP